MDSLGFRVAGKVAPEISNALPASVTELIVSAAVPEEVSVSVLVEIVLTGTSPNARTLSSTANSTVPDDD